MRGRSKHYDALREYCEAVPLVDTHNHAPGCGPKHTDPIMAYATGYFHSDLCSASSDAAMAIVENTELPLAERWAALGPAWRRTRHTGYAEMTRRCLKRFYGEDDLTLQSLQRMAGKLLDLSDPADHEAVLAEANIAVQLQDSWPDVAKVLDGSLVTPPRSRLAIGLPAYHRLCSYDEVAALMAPLGRRVTCLDEYLAGCREIFEGFKAFGAVTFKDQSAYRRAIDYGNPTRAEAEAVFNAFMADPRRIAAYPEGIRPLDDFLFHEFMRMARNMDLPVQIHTGHMAGIRNDIVKTNAAGLTSLIELHRDVQFDLFHANWPYSGEILYLCKNYPNVAIDFCWANIIDPVYCQRMLKQALSSVPHGKIHAYGSDVGPDADRCWAHAQIARDNIAIALSDMVDLEYLDLDEARQVAHDWLFANANAFFKLGL